MAANDPMSAILAQLTAINATIGGLSTGVGGLSERLTRLETLVATEAQRCPFREDLRSASNNARRIEKNEENIADLGKTINTVSGKVDRLVPIAGGSGGGAGALAAAVAMALAKLMGWM